MKHALQTPMLHVAVTLLLAASLLIGRSASTVHAQRPADSEGPQSARTVGQPVPSIPPGTAQWFQFNYSFTADQHPRPTVAVRLLDGVQNGLQFEIWSPERLQGNWRDNEPVGRGTQEVIAGCSWTLPDGSVVKCATNDYTWVGGFGALGVYYIRIINTSHFPIAPQVIVSGAGLGECVNPSPSPTPNATETLAGGQGYVLVQCQFAPGSAMAAVGQAVAATATAPASAGAATVTSTPTPAATPSVSAVAPTPAVTATVISTVVPSATSTSTIGPTGTLTPVVTPLAPATATSVSTQPPSPTTVIVSSPTANPTATVTPPGIVVAPATLVPTPLASPVPTRTSPPAATATLAATPAPTGTVPPIATATLAATPASTATLPPVATATLAPTAVPTRSPTASPIPTPVPPSTVGVAEPNQLTLDVTIGSTGNLSIGGLDMRAFGVEPLSGQAVQLAKQLESAHLIVQSDVVALDLHGTPILKMQWTPSSRQVMTELAARYGFAISSQVLIRAEEWISSSTIDITARYTDEPSKPLSANLTKPLWIDIGPAGQMTIEQVPLAVNLDPAFMQTVKQSGFKNILLCWNKGALKIKADGNDLPMLTLDKSGVSTLNRILGLRVGSELDPLFNSKFGVDVALPGGAHQAGASCGE